MQIVVSLFVGLLFGLGLVISGMANPAKVINFLDVFGTWDPSLIFVMGGAIIVTLPGYALLRKRTQPLFAEKFNFPTRSDLDGRLLAGAGIFGIGWGISGFCPGPAWVSLGMPTGDIALFVLAMLAGMIVARFATNPPLPDGKPA